MTATAEVAGLRTQTKAFYFNSSAHLLRITAFKADTLNEFLADLKACPEDSIFQHTFRTLQEHHFIREGFSNDFAQWILTDCNQPALAEQLASVDVRDFTSIRDLREQFVELVGEHLESYPADADQPARKTFYFCASDIVVIPTKFVARTLAEFAHGLKSVSIHSIHHHFIEARLRLQLLSNDFSEWLRQGLGLEDAAHAINQIDIYSVTLEDVRRQIILILEREGRESRS